MKDWSRVEELASEVIESAHSAHHTWGPGLLEPVYATTLAGMLRERGLVVRRQVPVPVHYKGIVLEEGFRADVLVEDLLLVELKSVELLTPLHGKQVLTYLRMLELPLGLLINFGASTLKQGLRRITNQRCNVPQFRVDMS